MVDDDPFLDTLESSQSEIDALGLFSSSSSSFAIQDDDSSESDVQVQEDLDDSTFIESLFSDKVYDRESLEDYLSLLLQSSPSFVFSLSFPKTLFVSDEENTDPTKSRTASPRCPAGASVTCRPRKRPGTNTKLSTPNVNVISPSRDVSRNSQLSKKRFYSFISFLLLS